MLSNLDVSVENPKVAVILPVYNVEQYLKECLESIVCQTYKNFIVFAVDDGSTDRSGKILDEFGEKDSRFCINHKLNGGVSSARNLALEMMEAFPCAFDLVCFVDGDDIIKPHFIRNYVDHFQRKLFKNPRAKPDGTKMFCSAFLNDARMCCFFANAIVKY